MLHEEQRRSPRGHNLIFLTLASKLKSLAWVSKPVSPWKMPSARDSTIFLICWKWAKVTIIFFCVGARQRPRGNLWRPFFSEDVQKFAIFFDEDLFFRRLLAKLRPWLWPRDFLSLASRESVFGKSILGLGLGFFCVLGLGLNPCVLESTSDEELLRNQVWS